MGRDDGAVPGGGIDTNTLILIALCACPSAAPSHRQQRGLPCSIVAEVTDFTATPLLIAWF
eukprot:SAG31_NODE_4555_length_3143_cov_5.394875_3_plen_61_part_00